MAILTARPVKKAVGSVTGTTVAPGVIAVIGALVAGAATVETAVAEVLGTETVGPEMTAVTGEILATNVAAHAPTGMETAPGMIAANSGLGDLPVAMMEADDDQARRVDASDAILDPLDNAE